jgi:hypothetical protein
MVPKEGVLVNLAVTLNEPVNKWLELAGYEPIPPELVTEQYHALTDEVLRSIESSAGREAKIEAAFKFVRAHSGNLGSSSMGDYPADAKLSLVRMFERWKHIKLLPDEIM